MGKFTIERWKCDRCGYEMDAKPHTIPNYSLVAHENLEWAGGEVIGWKEMCVPCNREVGLAIKQLKDDAKPPVSDQ